MLPSLAPRAWGIRDFCLLLDDEAAAAASPARRCWDSRLAQVHTAAPVPPVVVAGRVSMRGAPGPATVPLEALAPSTRAAGNYVLVPLGHRVGPHKFATRASSGSSGWFLYEA